jgi:hypothetical protein
MTTAILAPQADSLMTTDGPTAGSATAAEAELSTLTSELTAALNGAFWSFTLQAELEDAFDTALLRDAIADTPIYVDSPRPYN